MDLENINIKKKYMVYNLNNSYLNLNRILN